MKNKSPQLKYVERPTISLKPAHYNSRHMTTEQHDALVASIKRFQFVDPLIVNVHPKRSNIIIGGHQRWQVAKELGYRTVPCIEVSLTLEKERELSIRLNKNTGQFNITGLLQNFDEKELIEFGFTKEEISIELPELPNSDSDPHQVTKPVTVAFQLGEIRFELTEPEYVQWMDELISSGHTTDKEKVKCVKRRLKLS